MQLPMDNGYMFGMPQNGDNWFTRGMSNPLTHLGMGLLAASQPRAGWNPGDAMPNYGAGLLSGMQSYQQHQQGLLAQQWRQAQLQAQQERMAIAREELGMKRQEMERKEAARVAGQALLGTPPSDEGGVYGAADLGVPGVHEVMPGTGLLAGVTDPQRAALIQAAGADGDWSVIAGLLPKAAEPQSKAGKVAVDMGLEPGTPEYQAMVERLTNRPSDMQLLTAALARDRAEQRAAEDRRRQEAHDLRMRSENLRLQQEADEAALKKSDREASDKKANAFMTDTLEIVDSLLLPSRRESVERATGTIEGGLLPTLREGTRNVELDLAKLAGMLTKDNLDLLSGTISDADLALLTQISAGELDLTGSDERVINGLRRIQRKLSGALGRDAPRSSGGSFDLNTLTSEQLRNMTWTEDTRGVPVMVIPMPGGSKQYIRRPDLR